MPTSPMRPCHYPGCPNLVQSGYCAEHKGQSTDFRDPQRQGLYSTRLWQRIRHRQLAKEPWCAECMRAGLYIPATDVDHIERHMGDRVRFFRGPFQSLCHACHSRKTATETGITSKGRGAKNV